jgi:hypothetical protein
LASPAANPAGYQPSWHYDARALLSGARLLHARGRSSTAIDPEKQERTSGSMYPTNVAASGICISTGNDGCRSRRLRGGSSETTIPQEIAWRIFTKGIDRESAAAQVAVTGDRDLGAHVLTMVSIIG